MKTERPLPPERHLGACFFHRVAELGDRTFVKLQRREKFEEISWREFGNKVSQAIFALYALGLKKGDRVAIVGENSLEWLCADLATLVGGFPNVIVSPTLSDAMMLKILGHSGCRAAFVENESAVGRLLNLKGQVPSLEHLIVLDDGGAGSPCALSFDAFLSLGTPDYGQRLEAILESLHPDDLATIMYTSGSTGEPKGVMRTQNNLLANISNGGPITPSKLDDLTVIILSLNHLFGRFGFLKSAAIGRTTAVIEATESEVDLKIIETLAPTALALVPRVMEKIWRSMLDQSNHWKGWERLEALDQRKSEGRDLSAADTRMFQELLAGLKQVVRSALGGRIKYISYGAAPMPPRIMRFFELAGIPLLGSYGSTECGGVTLSGIGDIKPGSLGRPFPNVQLRIADDGELLVRGPTVTPGYYKNPEATQEVFDAEGWFYTGDLGKIDKEGRLYIVGRKKDVFNCSDGSNIYPGYIEALLESDRFVRQAILLGDRRPFMAALIVPERKQIAVELKKDESLLNDADIEAMIQSRINEINGGLEDYARIRKIAVMKSDFARDVRTFTMLQKIKIERKIVEDRYKNEINAIYSTASRGRTE